MAKFCTTCGAQLDDAVKFCASCGAAQQQPPAQPPQQQQAQAQQPQQQYQPQYQYQQPYAPAPKKKSKAPLIAGGIGGVCVVALALVLIFTNVFGILGKNEKKDDFGTDINNIDNIDTIENIENISTIDNIENVEIINTTENIDNIDKTDQTDSSDENEELQLTWEDYEITWEEYEQLSFGDATFTADTAKTVYGEYLPDDKNPLVLSMTDGNDLTWTLEIPAGACFMPVEISMTPLNDVTIGEYGEATSGVQLSPDGMLFMRPVKLTVSGAGITEDTIMFQGNHDGSDLNFVEYESDANGATAYMSHFSVVLPAGTDDEGYLPFDPEKEARAAKRIRENMRRDYIERMNKAVAAAQDYLKNPQTMKPIPKLTFACPEGSHKAQNEAHQKEALRYALYDFLQPEASILSDLFYTKYGDIPEEVVRDLREKLYDSLANKYVRLVIWTAGDSLLPEWNWDNKIEEYWKVIAVTSFVFKGYFTQHKDGFSASAYAQCENTYKMCEEWAIAVFNYWTHELAENHDYKAMHSLEEVARYNRMVEVEFDYEGLVSKALTFRLEFDLDLTDYDNSAEMGTTHIDLKGGTAQFKLETDAFGSCPEETFYFGKVGERVSDDPDTWAIYTYDGYDFTYTDVGEPFVSIMISSGEYEFFSYVLNFDPCINKKAEISTALIGNEVDDRPIVQRSNANFTATDTYISKTGHFMYCIEQKYMPDMDAYGLGCDIRNKEEEAVVQTFEYTGGVDILEKISGTIELRLIHEPEGDIYISSSSSNEPYPWER